MLIMQKLNDIIMVVASHAATFLNFLNSFSNELLKQFAIRLADCFYVIIYMCRKHMPNNLLRPDR